jgi:hypothetical protein
MSSGESAGFPFILSQSRVPGVQACWFSEPAGLHAEVVCVPHRIKRNSLSFPRTIFRNTQRIVCCCGNAKMKKRTVCCSD